MMITKFDTNILFHSIEMNIVGVLYTFKEENEKSKSVLDISHLYVGDFDIVRLYYDYKEFNNELNKCILMHLETI